MSIFSSADGLRHARCVIRNMVMPRAQFGRAQFGRAQYGRAQYGRAQYGRAQFGRAQYGRAQFGRAQYGRAQGLGLGFPADARLIHAFARTEHVYIKISQH